MYEYRKMGVSIEEHGWGWRLARTLLLIGKIFPGILLGICNFSSYVKSIKVLAKEILNGKERTIHYIRTFSENSPRLHASIAYFNNAIRISTLAKNFSSANCYFVLQFDDGVINHQFSLQPSTGQKELVDRIETVNNDLLAAVTQKRASLQKLYMLAKVAEDAAKTRFSIALLEYNTATSNDCYFSTSVAAAKIPEVLRTIDPNKRFQFALNE